MKYFVYLYFLQRDDDGTLVGVPSCRSNFDHRTSVVSALLPLMGPQGGASALLAVCGRNRAKVSLSLTTLLPDELELLLLLFFW